ncbi:hyaluronoglucosaminidase, partial [Oesophagostomum dentatum]
MFSTIPDLSFHGEHIATFHEFTFGRYPYYKKYNASLPINEVHGVLNTTIKDHLEVEEFDITNRTDENFSGLGIIHFEEWRPLFDQNDWKEKQVFLNQSIALVWERNSTTGNETLIKNLAIEEFNEDAKDFFLKTIKLAKKLRPKAKWGFYGFPYCNYNAGRNGEYECDQK